MNLRELSLDMLMEILERGTYSHLVVRDVLNKYNYMDSRDKAFVKRLTEGTLERAIQIDYILGQFSKVPVSKMKPLIRNLLRMSIYQLLFMDSIPDRAAINEAVKLAGKRGFRGLSGFVNGVLRSIAAGRDRISYPDPVKEKEQYLSVRYSIPEWIIRLWTDAYGEKRTGRILEEILKEPPLSVRLKERLEKKERGRWVKALEEKGIEAIPHPYLTYAFRIKGAEGIKDLPGYEEGYFMVQDVSSMLVAEAAGIPDGAGEAEDGEQETGTGLSAEGTAFLAVDVCAAPGGKSLHLAEKLSCRGNVLSRDISEYKVSLIRDNMERMGCKNMKVQVYDALTVDKSLIGKADVVIADLPCSGLGVIGRKRDIIFRLSPGTLKELEDLQRKILGVVWQYVKPGGSLIYSTCTMNPAENQGMVEWFTQNYPFTLTSLTPYLPQALKDEGVDGMLQLFPGIHETDGFFLAKLARKES